MILFKRLSRFFSKTNFPKDCDWEAIIKQANCKKEAKQLDFVEECGMCESGPDKNASVPEQVTDLTPINGVPCDIYNRSMAIIQKPPKNVMQQGTANTNYFTMHFTKDINWENPLMGWTSGANSLNDVEIRFPTKESAITFAERNGWDIIKSKEQIKKTIKKDYGANFKWNKRTRVSTK